MKNEVYCTKRRMKIELRNENHMSYPDTMVGLLQSYQKQYCTHHLGTIAKIMASLVPLIR